MRRWVIGMLCGAGCASAVGPPSPEPSSDRDAGTIVGADASASDAALSDSGPADTPDVGPIDPAPPVFAACDTSNWPDGYPLPAIGVECTTIAVPLDHGDPSGASLSLRVARAKSRAFPNGRAVFQLAGGPGGTSVGQSGLIPMLLPRLLDRFDLIYVDQRGTGGSGYLDCNGGYPATIADWRACGQQHSADPLDHYRTLDAAHDLEWVRRRLGYDRISLRAGSYGTRLALEMMRQHPDSLEAVVLDGVDPPDNTYFRDFTVAFDRGVTRLVEDCAASAGCRTVSPTLAADLNAWRQHLRANPRPIVIGGSASVEDEQAYLDTLDTAIADAYYRFSIPRAVHEIVGGNSARWNDLMSQVWGVAIADAPHLRRLARTVAAPLRRHAPVRGQSYVAPALFMSVLCAESLPNTPDLAALDQLAAEQVWGDHSTVDLARACSDWSVHPVDPTQLQPVDSAVKTLLMNGDLDLNTFPEEGARAAVTLSSATNLIVPYATHSTMMVPCAAAIMTAFFNASGDMSGVDTSCLGRVSEPAW